MRMHTLTTEMKISHNHTGSYHKKTHIKCVHSFDQSGLYEAPISSALSRRMDRSGFSKPLKTNTTFFISVWIDWADKRDASASSAQNTFKSRQNSTPVSTSTTTTPRLTTICRGLPEKGKTKLWILLKQETVSGSGIIWSYANLHLAPDR